MGNSEPLDLVRIEEALRALGLLYGTKRPFAQAAAGASDEREAIRAYIAQERPHLLTSYDMDALVELVRAAAERHETHGPVVEKFLPRG